MSCSVLGALTHLYKYLFVNMFFDKLFENKKTTVLKSIVTSRVDNVQCLQHYTLSAGGKSHPPIMHFETSSLHWGSFLTSANF